MLVFFPSKLKHKIVGKAASVAHDGLVKNLGWQLIEFCECAVEHHLVFANEIDPTLDHLHGNKRVSCDGRFLFSHSQMKLGERSSASQGQNRIRIPWPTSLEISRPTAAPTAAACRNEAD